MKFYTFVFLLAATNSASSETMRETFVGCKDTEQMSRIVRLLEAGDRAAFGKYATEKVTRGECTIIQEGETVHLEDFSLLSGRACVRPKGEPECFYIPAELIMK